MSETKRNSIYIKKLTALAVFAAGGKSADMPTTEYEKAVLEEGVNIMTLLVDTKLCSSRSDARRMVQQGGVSVNDVKVTDIDHTVTLADADEEGAILVKKGKKGFHQIKVK